MQELWGASESSCRPLFILSVLITRHLFVDFLRLWYFCVPGSFRSTASHNPSSGAPRPRFVVPWWVVFVAWFSYCLCSLSLTWKKTPNSFQKWSLPPPQNSCQTCQTLHYAWHASKLPVNLRSNSPILLYAHYTAPHSTVTSESE